MKKKNKVIITVILALVCAFVPSIFISQLIIGELSYDRWVHAHERVYFLQSEMSMPGFPSMLSDKSAEPMIAELRNRSDLVDKVAAVRQGNKTLTHKSSKDIAQKLATVLEIDGDFRSIFSAKADTYPELQIRDKEIVLSQAFANNMFKLHNPIGKAVYIEGIEQPYIVTAVIDELPKASHMMFDALVKMPKDFHPYPSSKINDWFSFRTRIYLRASSNASFPALQRLINNSISHNLGGENTIIEGQKASDRITITPVPITDRHFMKYRFGDSYPTQDKTFLVTMVLIAVLMVGVMSVSTANSFNAHFLENSKIQAIHRVEGASTWDVMLSLLKTISFAVVIATILAYGIAFYSQPWIKSYLPNQWVLIDLHSVAMIATILVIATFSWLINSVLVLWQAKQLSIIENLKGNYGSHRLKNTLMHAFIFFQILLMTISIFGYLTLQGQMDLLLNNERNVNMDNLYSIGSVNSIKTSDNYQFKQFAQHVEQEHPEYQLSFANLYIGMGFGMMTTIESFDKNFKNTIGVISGSRNLTELLGLKWVSGTGFSDNQLSERYVSKTVAIQAAITDQNDKDANTHVPAIVLSEKAAKSMGETANSILGKHVSLSIGTGINLFRVIGVVADTQLTAPDRPMQPFAIVWDDETIPSLLIRSNQPLTKPQQIKINKDFQQYFPMLKRSLSSVEHRWNDLAATAHLAKEIIIFASGFFILVAVVALYSSLSQIIGAKTQETFIRFLEGCSSNRRIMEISKYLLLMCGLGFMSALGLSLYLSKNWCSQFPIQYSLNITDVSVVVLILLITYTMTLIMHIQKIDKNFTLQLIKHQ